MLKAMVHMQTSLFDAATDSEPKIGPATWSDLVSLLFTCSIRTPHPGPIELGPRWRDDEDAWTRVKKKMPAWSPASFVGGRNDVNVTHHSLFVADLDKVPEEALASLRGRLRELGWGYILQPTPTDAPDARRFRLIVPYDVPVPAGRVKAVRIAVASLLRLTSAIDPKTKDLSRIYFLPCMTDSGVPPSTEYLPGVPIDTVTLERSAGIDLLVMRWPARGRHEAQLALAGGLVKSGIDEATALEILCDVCRGAGDEDRPKRTEAVRRAVDLHAACEPLRGWRFLSTILGSEPVALARSFLGAEGSSAPKTSIVLGRLHESVAASIKALASASNVYQKDMALVRVVHSISKTGNVSPTIQRLDPGYLRVVLSSVATFMRPKETKTGVEFVEVQSPPQDVVTGVYEAKEWPGIPVLTGVITAPAMRSDGTFITTPGYDDASGYLFEGLPPGDLPPHPTADDARDALARLSSVFGDFPFADDCPGATVVVAAALTIFARAAINSTPAFVFEASTRGSGKTMLTDVVSLIATGRVADRVSWPGAYENETEKLMASAAIEGRQMIVFDNIATIFGGPAIDKALTTIDRVSFRILGASEMRNVEWRTIIMGTGNNIELVEDTATRTLLVRLEPAEEHPEERTDFKETDLIAAVQRDRATLMRDALIILKAWACAGRPQLVTERKGVAGRFPSWNAVVPQALAFAGAPSICSTSSAVTRDDSDPTRGALGQLFAYFPTAFPRGALAKEIVKVCWPQTGMQTKQPEIAEALEILCEKDAPSAKQVAGALRKARHKVIGKRRLENHRVTGGPQQVWLVHDVH